MGPAQGVGKKMILWKTKGLHREKGQALFEKLCLAPSTSNHRPKASQLR
jgi:hypothetical protein